MTIKEYYQRMYKKEWEDLDSNRKVVFKKTGTGVEELPEKKQETPRVVRARGSLSKKILYYGFYVIIPVLMIPIALWLFDFIGSAVLVVVSDMGLSIKISLLVIQSIFTVLLVVSVRIMIQWFMNQLKQ